MTAVRSIPSKPRLNQDDFIHGTVPPTLQDPPRTLKHSKKYFKLEIPEELRKDIRLEVIDKDYNNMSTYICEILGRRRELDR